MLNGKHELNVKIGSLCNKQDRLSVEIREITEEKRKLLDDLMKNNTILSKDMIDMIVSSDELFIGDESLAKVDEVLTDLYEKTFYYLANQKIDTQIKTRELGYGENTIWVNTRGLAYRPQSWYSQVRSITNLGKIIRLVNKYQKELRPFFIERRMKYFDMFCECAKDWKFIENNEPETVYDGDEKIYGLNREKHGDFGLGKIEDVIYEGYQVKIYKNRLTIEMNDPKSSWHKQVIELNGNISLENRMLLSQIDKYGIKKIRAKVQEYIDLKNNNIIYLNRFQQKMSPYLVSREI